MKTVLVTGANKGIGFEICRQLGNLDFHVILSARNNERGTAAANKLRMKIMILLESYKIKLQPFSVKSV